MLVRLVSNSPHQLSHRAWPNFLFFVEIGVHHVGQVGLELLTPQLILPWPPKVLGSQARATAPGFFFFKTEFHSHCPGWSAVVQSRLTTTSAFPV